MYDNVAYALQVTGGTRKEIRAKVPDILRLTGLSTKLHNYPDQLSGGEQQRVSIARAFVNHPPLLLADEPTGNLDPGDEHRHHAAALPDQPDRHDRAVATHDQAMVDKMRRRVLELSRGRIVRDEATGLYTRDETTREFAQRLRAPSTPAAGASSRCGSASSCARRLRAMRRNAAPSFAALATVLVTMLVLGVFIPIVQATNGAANSVRSRVLVDVYMKTNATAGRRRPRAAASCSPSRTCKSVEFVSKAAGLRAAGQGRPAGLRSCSASNPLPDTFHVIPDNPAQRAGGPQRADAARGERRARGMIDPAIQSVSNKKNDTKKILEVTNLVTITAAALTVLLTLASILLIANTIRLSLYARRREVEVMKLVGATDWFIRWPFVIEGIVVGAAGALLAIVVLGVTKVALLDPLANNWTLIAAPRTIPFTGAASRCCSAPACCVSALGSGLSLRRFLRV